MRAVNETMVCGVCQEKFYGRPPAGGDYICPECAMDGALPLVAGDIPQDTLRQVDEGLRGAKGETPKDITAKPGRGGGDA